MKKPQNLIFGIRAVMEAIQSGHHLEKVFLQKNLKGDLITELMPLLFKTETPLIRVPVERLNKFTGKTHQGVVAFISPIQYHKLSHLIADTFEQGKTPLMVLLDGVTDVRNFGAIARTAEGTGVHGIIIPARGSAQINEDSMKTSAGALALIPICRVTSLVQCIDELKNSGFRIVGITEKSPNLIYDVHLKDDPLVMVLGSEEKGITSEVLSLCTDKVAIPMGGKIGSYNVSVAAGMTLYEVLRQRSK